jgi:hypothetical protein
MCFAVLEFFHGYRWTDGLGEFTKRSSELRTRQEIVKITINESRKYPSRKRLRHCLKIGRILFPNSRTYDLRHTARRLRLQ